MTIMKTNKQVIAELTEYFLTQDPRVIAKACAANMIDIMRMWEFQTLPPDEQKSLMDRIYLNVEALKKFAKEGPDGNLQLHNMDSDQ